MADQPGKPSRPEGKRRASREDRLAAALKANLARRKAQARERSAAPAADPAKPDTPHR